MRGVITGILVTLVRLVQTFASRNPLLDGHGNFGSFDDDPPAAMRYTETRLAPIANEAMLDEIGSDTVDFANNFDGSQQEPTVLPAQLPFLLLNGCTGIAVGMATNIPTHNLGEVVDALIALVRKPELSDEKLLELVPGPDFPTGGEVLTGSGLRDTYLYGRGSIPMRGVAHIEEIQPAKGHHKRDLHHSRGRGRCEHIRQSASCGRDAVQHGIQVLHIRRLVAHAHRHDHLMVAVDSQLAVLALDVMAIGFHEVAVGVGEIPLGLLGWRSIGLSR